MKVLIVEDEIIAASYLKKIVTKIGYDVAGTINTGQGAIELAKSKEPDLILMNIMLKDNISSVDAAVKIRYTQPDIMVAFLNCLYRVKYGRNSERSEYSRIFSQTLQ